MDAASQHVFREQVVAKFHAALGEPEISCVRSGRLYRWSLARPNDLTMYVTINSPERADIAHVMISDGSAHQWEPIVTLTIQTHAEVDSLLGRIARQWKSPRSSQDHAHRPGGVGG
jgi:hypothetical protein